MSLNFEVHLLKAEIPPTVISKLHKIANEQTRKLSNDHNNQSYCKVSEMIKCLLLSKITNTQTVNVSDNKAFCPGDLTSRKFSQKLYHGQICRESNEMSSRTRSVLYDAILGVLNG